MIDKKLFLLFLISTIFTASCTRQEGIYLSPSLSPSSEGKLVAVEDIINLKCVLETGGSLDKKVYQSDAKHFNLEVKKGDRHYDLVNEGTIVYKYKDSGGDQAQGYINNFSYVSIKSIKHKTPLRGDRESKQSANCKHLMNPESRPSFIGRSHYTYDLRFQITGSYLRVLVIAPAKDIPYQAIPYSSKLAGNLYAMPIGGYKIKLGHTKETSSSDTETRQPLVSDTAPVKNVSKNSSSILLSYLQNNRKLNVEYVQIRSSFIPFKNLLESGKKRDVYPKKSI